MKTFIRRAVSAYALGTRGVLIQIAAIVMVASVSRGAENLNIVGYVNRPIVPGVNLIADQLWQGLPGSNYINLMLTGVPDGAMFTKWSGNSFLPFSYFDGSSQTWSINYTLNAGEGGWFVSPSAFAETFVGSVPNYQPIGSDPWQPNYSPGLHLISACIPLGGSLSYVFTNVVGRTPLVGESVWMLNEGTQSYVQDIFNGVAWQYDLNLNVSQAAWFDIGATGQVPPPVPEPSGLVLALATGGLLLAWQLRLGSRRRS